MSRPIPTKGSRWVDYMRAGREIERVLPGHMTYREIAKELGARNHQTVYMECLVALGKVAVRLRNAMKEANA